MIQINPLKSYIDGGVRAALTTPPSASLVFDLPGKAIWVKGVKLKGTDHTYTFSHDNYITLTNTPDSNESEDIKIGVNTSALKSAIDTTYGVVSTTANGLAPKFTSGNKQAVSAATTYYFLGWAGSTLKWYQAPFRNIRINSETTDCLGVNNTDPLIIGSGNGISVTWDSTNKKIIITNTKPDVNHNTHYTTMLYIGENNDTKANKNVVNPYLKLFDDNTRRATFQIKAGSGIAVASDANGNITITNSSPDVNHNTDRTGIKLTTVSGTKKTDSTLILANSITGLNIQGGTNKFLIGDGTNYIEIPIVPSFTVTNKAAIIGTTLTTIATIAGIDITARISLTDILASVQNIGNNIQGAYDFNSTAYLNFGVNTVLWGGYITNSPWAAETNHYGVSVRFGSNSQSFQLLSDRAEDTIWFRTQGDNKIPNVWRKLLSSNNYASILDSRYYTESEINSLLSNKLNISTFNWTNLPGKLVAGNEFNIVNAGYDQTMWFNYLPINDSDSTAYIHSYHFGNGQRGYAPVQASGFVKTGSSSSYVLLGDGGHKAISDFATSEHNHDGKYLRYEGWWSSKSEQNVNDSLGMTFTYPNHGAPRNWGTTVTFEYARNSEYRLQLHGTGDNYLYFRNRSSDYGGWHSSGWKQILTNKDTYVSENKGYINNTEITQVNNSDTIDGYHATCGTNKPWGTIPVIHPNGWMDVGKQFEFHYDNTTGSDYSTVLRCTGNYGNAVNLPSASGTLALTSQIPNVTNYYWANIKISNASNSNTAPTFGSAIVNTRLSIASSTLTKTNPTNQQLVINGPSLDSSVTPGLKDWPGIGFHMPSRTWGSLIFNGNITAINGDYNGYINYYGAGFRKNGSSDSYVLLGGGGHKALSDFMFSNVKYALSDTIGGKALQAYKLYYISSLVDQASIDNFHEAYTFKYALWNGNLEGMGSSFPGTSNGIILSGGWASATYGFQLAIDDDPNYFIALRQRGNGTWSNWKRIPMADGTGASGTWSINITGNADTLDNYHANGLLTALSNSNNGVSITVGGTTKSISNISVNYANSSGNADTVDGYHASNLVKFYLSPMTNDAPADSAKSWFINTMPSGSGAIVYNVPGSEKTIIASKSTGAYGHMLQLNYDNTYLKILRYYNGSWKSTDWEKIAAGYADSAGNADTVDGLHVHSGRNNEANKIIRTDGSGYIQAGWINTTSGDMGTTTATRVYCSDDAYIRYKTLANFSSDIAGQLYWANVKVSTSSNAATSPTFGSLWINNSYFFKQSGTTFTCQGGTTFTLPSSNINTNTALLWTTASDGARDTGIFYNSSDFAFIANSNDHGAVFAVYDTDVTQDFEAGAREISVPGSGGALWARGGFSKNGSSNDYVLLGGGGHKAISDFSMSHSHPYLPLAGGNMNSGARIAASEGNLYLGNSSNSAWVLVQDLCSQLGSNYWNIAQNGNAFFTGNVGIGTSPSYKLHVNGTLGVASNVKFTGLPEGSSTVTDNTEILTSWASNNGFADSNDVGGVYRRDAIHLYNYIKGKTDSIYLPLAGGTMTGTIITPGNDSVVIKPAKNNYDQIGGEGQVFFKIWATNFYGTLHGSCDGNAATATNADTVDGQHFNWNNNKNDHTYLWAASDNGNAYLVHRASISVNYATYARYVYCTSGNYLNFQWSGQNGQPTWLWGSNDGANCYVWDPSNFSVYKANKSDQLEAYTSWGFTDGGHFVRAIRYDSWHTRLYMGYYRDATLENTVHVGYADDADTLDGNHASAFALVGHTHNYDNVYSKLGHTHDDRYYTESEINSKLSAYLPLAGGTMTGQIKGNNKGGSWIQGRANAALYQPRNVQGDWHPVVGFKTKTGSWEFGSVGYDDNASFSWESDSNYNSGTNTTTVVYLRNTSGTIALTSEIPTVTNYYWANMKVSSTSSTNTSPTFNTCYTSNWFRSTGQTGWYNETYAGGWYMTDTTWVRTYNSKGIYTNTGTIYNLGHVWLACNNGYNVGIGTISPSYKLHVSGDSYTTGWSRAASGFYCQDTGVHFTHNGTKGQIAITSNNEFCWGAKSNILYFNYATASQGTTVTQYVWNAGSSSSYASHTMGHITLGNGSYQLKRVGSSSSWYNGRDKAIVRQTSNAGDYCVMMSSKTTSGSWEIGNEYDDLCFTHITDSNYNSRNNNYLGQIVFTSDGEVYAAHFYENSDIRYKKILKNLSINSNTIANLPLFDFEWIENNSIGTGTSAQAVQQILPNLVSGTDKLTLDYGVLGTIAGITACKELVTQKSELQQLKEKVKQLEDKLRKYENI